MKTPTWLLIFAGVLTVTFSVQAQYFRFWRGHIKDGMSYQQFHKGLNEIFVPATGALAQTQAKLQSYQPVLFSNELIQKENLPAEIALVEYESEQSYQNFRATNEGKYYGDLHWDYFKRENSRSSVPTAYVNQIENEKSYILTKKNNFSFYRGHSFFKVYKRETKVSEIEWHESIKSHIERIQNNDTLALIFLVSADYLMEFNLSKNANDNFDPYFETASKLVFNQLLPLGNQLEPNTGIKFRF